MLKRVLARLINGRASQKRLARQIENLDRAVTAELACDRRDGEQLKTYQEESARARDEVVRTLLNQNSSS